MRHYRARSTEECQIAIFFTSRGAYVNLRYIAMLYTHSIGNQPQNTMVVFKRRDSVSNGATGGPAASGASAGSAGISGA